MPKLGPIEFPDLILDALRDERLVVFAGAGVSAGPPSNLPLFGKLAEDIAAGTGNGRDRTEPIDRFLGRLQHQKVAVHDRAEAQLTRPESKPNALHTNLLKLFRAAEQVKLVTTNFDLHFETAAQSLFGNSPDIYQAPALPLGNRFSGIVHVHGAVTHAQDMVLTDADFGRAYLTEGWARRFLVEVFRHYTVVFVGYSHEDVVMNYLARALPAESVAGRFVLTEEVGSWELLGIKPIRFKKGAGPDAYSELYDGIQRLAERAGRGALDWQSRIAEIGGGEPPADEEAIEEVLQALREVHTTRFLTGVARLPRWPRWLDSRKQLDALFGEAELSERDTLLAWWLAQHYAIEHPEEMFDLFAGHGMRVNPALWRAIGRELGVSKDKTLQASALKRWTTLMLANAPAGEDHHILMWLAERCAIQGLIDLVLKVFLFMSQHRLNIKRGFVWQDAEEADHGHRLDVECPLRCDHWSLNEIWSKHLHLHMAAIAERLIASIALRLEEIHHDLMAWDKAQPDWDSLSYGRSAIEPHEQDQHPEAIDVLIDAGRDALEWLGANAPSVLDSWIERLGTSQVPLLRRLAVHSISFHPGRLDDERLRWVLDRIGLHSVVEHHEVFRAVALAYPGASSPVRQKVVDAVLAYELPASDEWSAEKRTARAHFDWLSWLGKAEPKCVLIQAALAPITAEFPEWRASEHPDLTHWIGVGWKGPRSPWTVQELLARAPDDQLEDLLRFKGDWFEGPDRDGLITVIKEGCTQQPTWSFALARSLIARSLWTSDLWPAVMRGWQDAELTADDWREVLAIVATPDLQAAHSRDIANLLYSVVRDGGKPFALQVLEQANTIALATWQGLSPDESDGEITDWLSQAINRPAGVIVEYWINGLSLLMRGKSGSERVLPDNYKQWFTMVVRDQTSKGGLGRSLLASQIAFLFGLDEAWAQEHVVPLFSDADRQIFGQAWDGFLAWGRLNPALVDALMPAFLNALQRLSSDFPDRRRRFVEYFAALAVFHVNDPTQNLLPAFFQNGSAEDRSNFTSQLGYFLRQMQATAKQQLWDRWLFRYWQERLQSVPAPLDDAEVRGMLDWLSLLDGSFPAAVSLAVRLPQVQLEHGHLLFDIRDSDLVTRYPVEMANLLIYLCNGVVGYHVADLGTVAGRLPPLPSELEARLNEALARVGANRRPSPQ